MNNANIPITLLDENTAAFVQQYVSINLATTNSASKPMVARAYGCRVSAERDSITVYIDPTQNQELLDNIESNHKIAVVFSRPSTHQTIQLKGLDARIVPLTADDIIIHKVYKQSMLTELQSIGFPLSFADALIQCVDEKHMGIRFTPEIGFTQTPGPDAGKKIAV